MVVHHHVNAHVLLILPRTKLKKLDGSSGGEIPVRHKEISGPKS